MAKYGAELNKGVTSVTIGVGSLEAPATGMRRLKLYDMLLGSEATPADNVFLWRVKRTSAASTGTAVTPRPLDPADAAAGALPKENLTAEGASSEVLLSVPLNQRATFRWVAAPGSEIVIAAVAAAGVILETPTASGTPAATAAILFEEQ